jgi:hypothetical protein
VDNIRIDGPRTDYKGEEVRLGVYRFVLKHLINVNKVLIEIKLVGMTLAGEKT